MAITRQVPPVPTDAKLIDARGNISPEWQNFFMRLTALLKEIVAAIP